MQQCRGLHRNSGVFKLCTARSHNCAAKNFFNNTAIYILTQWGFQNVLRQRSQLCYENFSNQQLRIEMQQFYDTAAV